MTRGLVRLDRLTSLRFFAALLVVVHHTSRDLLQLPGVTQFFSMGTVGVEFFFALSGFVLTWSARPDDTAGRFYGRRFARVYPLHAATWLLAFPVLLATGQDVGAGEAISNLLLLHAWWPDPAVYFGMNSPSWSLSGEAFFYAIFPFALPLLARLPRRRAVGFLVGLVAGYFLIAAAVSVTAGSETAARYWLYLLPAFRVLGFLAGVTLALLLRGGWRVQVRLPVAVSLTVVGYVAVFAADRALGGIGTGLQDALMLPFFLLLIGSAAQADLDGIRGVLTRRAMIRLGEWSFALYLTHWPVMLLVNAHAEELADAAVGVRAVIDLLFVTLAVGVAALAYTGVERPLERRLRPGRAARPEMTAADPASV